MALVTLKQLLDIAAEREFGIPAFNVNNLEQVQAIMNAADQVNAPVILQASAGARRYAGSSFLKALLHTAVSTYPHLPVCLHQDHGASPAVCMQSIQLGFSSVMMDGSLNEDMKTPSSFDYNIAVTREVVRAAHPCGVSVEGELGCLGSLESHHAQEEDGSGAVGELTDDQLLTNVEQAIVFVKETQVDALAIAIGTSHGVAKFTKPPESEHILALGRLAQLHQALPNTHFVMHGSSSVPQELLHKINQYGGSLPLSFGVPVAAIQKAITLGVRKINIDTDLRLAATAAIRAYLFEHPDAFDPRYYLAEARKAMQQICIQRFTQFGCCNQAPTIKVKTLEEVAKLY
ncbi:fructose-bisphosphate aldolase class II [bacterium]|nr:fructose-bisphosphate aldolase class II [bacterium]NBW57743.1 fructose-bisphosphate aldolase class II [bacterium]NBX71418.1 fructose-bisphosphate aldolase class II [bacterium]